MQIKRKLEENCRRDQWKARRTDDSARARGVTPDALPGVARHRKRNMVSEERHDIGGQSFS